MIPAPARYLLRLDDLCPTVHRERWQSFRELISEFHLRPILAVVPVNRDPALELSPPDPDFWNQLRALESAGAVIGLHGYRHICASAGKSLVGLHRLSEFASVDAKLQRAWIAAGLSILRSHGLNPTVFVAPRHGFDANTLSSLRTEGITVLSDGFARVPFLRNGIAWIPQQLWAPAVKTSGLWTICIHPNTISDAELEQLRAFLRAHSAQFSSIGQLLADFPPATLSLAERVYTSVALWRARTSSIRKRLSRTPRASSNSV
jgi:predicted deacetylase